MNDHMDRRANVERRRPHSAAGPRGAGLTLAFRLLRRLQAGRWTMSELGASLGRGKRTAYRLIEVLEGQGLRIDRKPDGREVLYEVSPEEVVRWLHGPTARKRRVAPNTTAEAPKLRPRCSVLGCSRPVLAHGRCHAHDMRWRNGWALEGSIRPIRRLTDKEAARVRRRYIARDAPTIQELAEAYGVARVTIWRVLHARSHSRDDGLQQRIVTRMRANANR